MMKLAAILLFVGAAAASGIVSPLVTSQRATIPHYSPYNYLGNGISSRYQTKADYGYGAVGGLGLGLGAGLYGGLAYGNGLLNNGLAGNVILGNGGLGYGGLGYGGIGYNGLGLIGGSPLILG